MVRVLYVREKVNLNQDILTLLGLNSHQKLALVYLLVEINCMQIYGIFVPCEQEKLITPRPRRFDPPFTLRTSSENGTSYLHDIA